MSTKSTALLYRKDYGFRDASFAVKVNLSRPFGCWSAEQGNALTCPRCF